MKQKGWTDQVLADKIGVHRSTLNRFFNLEFCLRFDYVLKIIHGLDLNMFLKTQDDESEMNKAFEKAMEELGRRQDKLPKN